MLILKLPDSLAVLWASVGAFNGAFELHSACSFRPFLPFTSAMDTHKTWYRNCRSKIFYIQNSLDSSAFIDFKGHGEMHSFSFFLLGEILETVMVPLQLH